METERATSSPSQSVTPLINQSKVKNYLIEELVGQRN